MLEIVGIIILTRHVGKIVKEKGRKPGWYQFMAASFWIVSELLGALIGTVIFGEGLLSYAFAVIGAGIGVISSVSIAKKLPDIKSSNSELLDSSVI